MSKKAPVPDAWDDDWEAQADQVDAEAQAREAEEQVKITKAERLKKHAETNKKIWEKAYTSLSCTMMITSNNTVEKHPRYSTLSKPVTTKSLLSKSSNLRFKS
jgi:hypothetical protein